MNANEWTTFIDEKAFMNSFLLLDDEPFPQNAMIKGTNDHVIYDKVFFDFHRGSGVKVSATGIVELPAAESEATP